MSDATDPTVQAADTQRMAELRSRAASRLGGAAAGKAAATRAVDALAVLHALASSPDTAVDALTLLHELQVHQVELDLQAHELRESRIELEAALRRQLELYDGQPAGCFTLDALGNLLELNQSGADMLGIGRDEAEGMALDGFLEADSARLLRSALASHAAGTWRNPCALAISARGGAPRPVLACIGADPAADRYLVNLMPDGEMSAERAGR